MNSKKPKSKQISHNFFVVEYEFIEKLWKYNSASASWYFIHVPPEQTLEIKTTVPIPKVGWGSVRVQATIGKTTWKTSIFPNNETATYLLPIKAEVRKAEQLEIEQNVKVHIKIGV